MIIKHNRPTKSKGTEEGARRPWEIKKNKTRSKGEDNLL
jgi:hypothetical protein